MRQLIACFIGLGFVVISELLAWAPERPAPPPALPDQALPLPLVRQEADYSCGPAALRSVLQYFGVFDGREQELYKLVDTSTTDGTLPEKLAAGARHFGLTAVVEEPMTIVRLRALQAAGKPVILEIQAWRDDDPPGQAWREDWDDGHYVVLIGMDGDYAYFMDPSMSGAYTYLPLSELVERWHDINTVRKDPRDQRDVQLGVVFSGTPRSLRLATRRLQRLE